MKTLILNGSPRRHGDTVTLIDALIQALSGEVYQVNAYYDPISPCIDCRYCWSREGCIIKDDMGPIYRLMQEADNFVIASPLYYSELTGALLNVVSRLQPFYAARYIRKDPGFQMKPKLGALLLAAGGSTKDFKRASETAELIFEHTNTKLVGRAVAACTDQVPAHRDRQALEAARTIAERLNAAHGTGE